MAKPEQPEQGERKPYSARYGVDVGWCTGLDLSHDPSMIADTALRQAVNVRIHDGIPISRGGQSTPLDSPGNGCIQGMIDIEGYGTRAVLADDEGGAPAARHSFMDESLSKLAVPNGPNYVALDATVEPHPVVGDVNGTGSYTNAAPRFAYTWWNGDIVFQDTDTKSLFKIVFPDDVAINSADFANKIQVEELFELTVPGEGSSFTVASMTVMPSTNSRTVSPLYFGTLGGGVVGYVNGELVRLLAESTLTGRSIVFTYNNRLYVAANQELRYQSNGWSSGGSPAGSAWSVVAMPAGPSDFRPMSAIEYGGFGYIGGFNDPVGGFGSDDGYLLQIDDSGGGAPALTVRVNGVGGGNDLKSVDDFAVGIGNQIFVAYRERSSASAFAKGLAWDQSLGAFGVADFEFNESDEMIQRMQGTEQKIYLSAFSGDTPAGMMSWDGSSLTQIVDLVGDHGYSRAPYDMVLF